MRAALQSGGLVSAIGDVTAQLIKHPSVGALALVFAATVGLVGYWWGNQTFAKTVYVAAIETDIDQKLKGVKDDFSEKLNATRNVIVREVTHGQIKRDIRHTEDAIHQVNQRIQFGLCATDDCAFEKAEKQRLERRVDQYREDLDG